MRPSGPDGKRRSDGLNRNQFGGSLGGPVVRDRMFYFVAYQRTRVRRVPTSNFQFVPTPAMLAGDFTAITSPACNGRQITLNAPFVGNRIDPALFSPASLKLTSLLGATPDNPCGQVFFDRVDDSDEDVVTTKVDYTFSGSHSIFGRLQFNKYDSPTNYDGTTAMSFSQSSFKNRVYSLAIGDTKLFGNNVVNSFRATLNRGNYTKDIVPLFDYSDLGVRATPVMQDYMRLAVTGGFSVMGPGALPTGTPTWTYQFANDLSIVRGAHQFGVGADYIHNKYDSTSYLAASGNTSFTGQVTGLGLADFLLGRAASFSAGTLTGVNVQNHYIGIYAQDSWRISPNLTLNVGLRWDPYLPVYSAEGRLTRFDRDRFNQGLRSSVFPNAPPGLVFPGDDAMPGQSIANNDWWNFAPRVGIVVDPKGEGLETLRVSYGRLYDLPHMQTYSAQAQMSPWGNTSTVTNMPQGWDNPWVAVPGGDPIPSVINGPSAASTFPLGANYTTYPLELPATETDQWNVSYQRQIARDWMVSANYLGNVVRNVWTANQTNPAVFGAGATVANTNQRRQLFLQNPAAGQYYASIQELDPNGTSNYHGLLLSMQRRRADGFSLQGNYTISRCITDRWNQEPGVSGTPYLIPGDRESDRGKCQNSPEHSLNASVVYQVPAAGSGVTAAHHRRLASVGDPQRALRFVLQRDHRRRQRAHRAAESARQPGARRSVHARPHVLAVAQSGSVPSAGERHVRHDADRCDSGLRSLERRHGSVAVVPHRRGAAGAAALGSVQRAQHRQSRESGGHAEQPGLRQDHGAGRWNRAAHHAVRGEVSVLTVYRAAAGNCLRCSDHCVSLQSPQSSPTNRFALCVHRREAAN